MTERNRTEQCNKQFTATCVSLTRCTQIKSTTKVNKINCNETKQNGSTQQTIHSNEQRANQSTNDSQQSAEPMSRT